MVFNFQGVSTDDEGDVIVLRVNGGMMPAYIGVLVVASGATSAPNWLTTFPTTTTFNKSAIPDYHGASGTPEPTYTPRSTSTPTATVPAGSTSTATATTQAGNTATRTPTAPAGATATRTATAPAGSTATRTPTAPTGATATRTATVPPGSTATPTSIPGSTNTPTPVATECAISFSDVPTGYWAYQYIYYMACRGIISGYADGTFRPYNDTTRGQLSKIVVLAEGWPVNTQGAPHFTDVSPGSPFYAYVETAYNRGVISGYSDGTFHPEASVTRGQLSKIMVTAQGWPINTQGAPHFTDVLPNNPFYVFIETAYNRGIISGYADNTFRWGTNSTRAQISKTVFLAITQR